LRGEPKERRKILVELLGLKSYERMGALARERAKTVTAETTSTQSVLDTQYADVGEQRLGELNQQDKAAKERSKQLARSLKSAEALESRRVRTGTALQSLEKLDERASAGADELTAMDEGLAETIAEKERRRTLLEQAGSELEKSRASFDAAETALSELVKTHGDLASVIRVENALESIGELEAQQSEHEQALGQAEEKLAEAHGNAERDAAQAGERTVELQKAEKANAEARAAAESAEGRAGELSQQALDATSAHTEREKASEAVKVAAERLDQAEGAVTSCTAEVEQAEQRRETADSENHVAALAIGLEPGDACPVCQRPLAEHPATAPDAAALLQGAREQEAQARKRAEEALTENAAAQGAADAIERELEKSNERLQALLSEHGTLETLQTAAASTAAESEEATRHAEAAAEAEGAARNEESAASRRVTESAAARKLCEERVADANKTLADDQQQLAGRRATVAEHFSGTVPDDLAAAVSQQRAAVETATASLADAQGQLNDAMSTKEDVANELQACETKLGEMVASVAAIRGDCSGLRANALDVLTVLDGKPLPEVPSASVDPRADRSDLHRWCESMIEHIGRAEKSGARALGDVAEEFTTLLLACEVEQGDEDALEALRRAARSADEQKGRAGAEVTEMKRRIKERKDLETGIAEKRSQAAVLNVVATELRQDHLIDFILHETLELLAVRASEELLRISDGRYELCSKEGDFAVIDHVNADETRDVSTLSGGETFLASLALALALSQHIGDLATEGMGAKLESVWIDEGFDSLDPETLDDVINALERLREAELVVGVITHVAAMAQRINVGLAVDKDGGRSQIRPVDALRPS
jgi:exonuclease SbcC